MHWPGFQNCCSRDHLKELGAEGQPTAQRLSAQSRIHGQCRRQQPQAGLGLERCAGQIMHVQQQLQLQQAQALLKHDQQLKAIIS